jgi:DNA-binding response OmpR family regulator
MGSLSAAGHQVSEAKAGIEGVAAFHARHPALVITEIVMSRNEGIETIRELRREAPTLPILAISGDINPAFFLNVATVLGTDAALVKSFNPGGLLRVVAKLLPPEAGATIVATPICLPSTSKACRRSRVRSGELYRGAGAHIGQLAA